MFDPTDAVCTKFDEMNEIAAQRGWPESSHVHPTRYGETVRIEKLEAPRRGEVRTSAVRAIVRLAPAPGKDDYAFVQSAACFLTGCYRISYFDGTGSMLQSMGGNVVNHRLNIDRRDVQQALGTAFELNALGALARVLREGGHSGDGERLTDMLSVKRGEGPDAFHDFCWPKLNTLLREAPLFTDPARTLAGLTAGRWIAVATGNASLRLEIFRLAEGSKTSPEECFFRAQEATDGLVIAMQAHEKAPGFPILDDMPLGADVSISEPAKVFEVPDALVEEIRTFVPPQFEESFQLDL